MTSKKCQALPTTKKAADDFAASILPLNSQVTIKALNPAAADNAITARISLLQQPDATVLSPSPSVSITSLLPQHPQLPARPVSTASSEAESSSNESETAAATVATPAAAALTMMNPLLNPLMAAVSPEQMLQVRLPNSS